MVKKSLVWIIVLVGILLIVGGFWVVRYGGEGEDMCVSASCCHPKECVLESEAPNCSGVFCSMNCVPETMDCGQGHCGIIDGECEVIWDE